MADWTGLEPATPGVTGRYSNRLNYQSADRIKTDKIWWVLTGSNRRPSACKADALPAELNTHFMVQPCHWLSLKTGAHFTELCWLVKCYFLKKHYFFQALVKRCAAR